MPIGDGAWVRAALDALVSFLRHFASPTGARGSVLLMSGGLIVLGFLFLAFLFRSAIVGDLAPHGASITSGARFPRVRLPRETARARAADKAPPSFRAARQAGRKLAPASVDDIIESLLDLGSDARIVLSGATMKRVRLYACASCATGHARDCEAERAFLAGAFESLTGQLAKVDEVACRRAGAPHCEFDVKHHAAIRRVARLRR